MNAQYLGIIPDEFQLMHVEVQEVNNDIVSYCSIETIDEAYNVSIVTKKPYQNRGFGGECANKCIQWWVSQNFKENLHWWCTKNNEPSIRLALQNGFSLVGSMDGWNHYILYPNKNIPPKCVECPYRVCDGYDGTERSNKVQWSCSHKYARGYDFGCGPNTSLYYDKSYVVGHSIRDDNYLIDMKTSPKWCPCRKSNIFK